MKEFFSPMLISSDGEMLFLRFICLVALYGCCDGV